MENCARLPFDQLVNECIKQLEKMENRRILAGIGELLAASQKDWAKAKLRDETITLLKLRIGS